MDKLIAHVNKEDGRIQSLENHLLNVYESQIKHEHYTSV